jgi:hypothetical protein
MTNAANTTKPLLATHCGRCGRTLTDPRSITLGLGPTCAKKIAAAATATDASPSQIEKAVELIEDGAIVRITPAVFLAVSTDGSVIYETSPLTGECSCRAGQHQRRCFHLLAAEWLLGSVPLPAAPVAPAGSVGRPVGTVEADPFAVFAAAA